MTKSSKHKSHKQSKHSSKDYYSDSDDDVVKMDRTSYKDDNSVRSHRDSASGEKRKVVSLVRDGKEGKDVLDEYVSSKRRKDKWDVVDDRWNGGGEDVEKEVIVKVESKSSKSEIVRVESKTRDSGSKSEVLRVESKSKSRRHESERKDDGLVEKEESKGKGESRRKSEKDYSSRREKESKDKERKSEKESKRDGEEMKLVEVDVGKKEVVRSVDVSEDRHGKRSRSNADRTEDGSWNPELEKESEKKMHKSREVSSERDKHRNDSKEASERRLSTRSDRAKETKHGDDKKKAESYADKNQEDVPKDVRQRDDKNRKESDKDTKYWDARYREDGEKGHREDKREDSNKDHRRKDEKHRDKYKEGSEREHRDDKYYKDDRRHEDDYKDNRKDEKYYEDGERDNRVKDGQHREDVERDVRHKDKKQGDDLDRENRQRSTKYRDDGYAADHHHSRKSKAYDDSPTRDDRTSARYRDDQARKKLNERDDYGDVRSRSTKEQRSNAEKKSATMDVLAEKGRSTSRTADIELSSGHGRRRNSPGISSHDARDHFRAPKQDESKFREINHGDRVRHNTSSTREYAGTGGSEKTSPWSLEKNGQKGDTQIGELSGERRRNPDIRPSSLQRHDKSPSSNTEKRQFSRSDVRSTGFRDPSEYTGKEGRDVLPGNDFSQADTDTVPVSSPSVRNSYISNNSKSFPPPPHFKAGMDSPFPLNSTEDESRSKSNNRQRRPMDPNMGRMPGNAWKGMPNWPSPVPNGYMPFHHAPSPAGFMQPFPTPQIFGVRPSMELNHPLSSPYHMPDADRFAGQVHPMWRNQVNGSFSSWDGSGSGFVDESYNYGRPNWDPSGNMLGVRGWGTGGDMWKGSNKTASLEKENNSTRSGDQSVKPAQSEQAQAEQQAESTVVSQPSRSGEKNEVDAHVIGQDEGSDKSSEKGDLCLSHVYLSRLDISADLVEPEVFDRCSALIDMDQSVVSDIDDSKILCMKEAVEPEVAPHEMLNYTLFPSTDDSIFQKAMSLYKRQRDNFKAEVGEKIKIPSIPSPDQEDQLAGNIETEKVSPTDDMQGVEVDPTNNSPMLEMELETTQKETDQPTDAEITAKSEEHESVELPDASLPTELKEVSEGSENQNQEVDTKLGDPILNNDVSSEVEAVMHESVVSGPVNLSRIHHSPESTH